MKVGAVRGFSASVLRDSFSNMNQNKIFNSRHNTHAKWNRQRGKKWEALGALGALGACFKGHPRFNQGIHKTRRHVHVQGVGSSDFL